MKNEIIELLLSVCAEVNQLLKHKIELNKGAEAELYGKAGVLDSMGLVNLIVTAETAIETKYGVSLMLTEGTALPVEHSPFRTIETLADYIVELLKK